VKQKGQIIARRAEGPKARILRNSFPKEVLLLSLPKKVLLLFIKAPAVNRVSARCALIQGGCVSIVLASARRGRQHKHNESNITKNSKQQSTVRTKTQTHGRATVVLASARRARHADDATNE